MWDSVDALEAHCKTLGSQVETLGSQGETLGSQVSGVEADLQHMHQHTKKLDIYINDMLKQMLGTLNQGESLPFPPRPFRSLYPSPCPPSLILSLPPGHPLPAFAPSLSQHMLPHVNAHNNNMPPLPPRPSSSFTAPFPPRCTAMRLL